MSDNISANNKFINFYGRTTGHLSKRSVYLLENLLSKYLLNIDNLKDNSFYKLAQQYEKVNLEIGFGSGDFLFNSVINNPNSLYLGVEVFSNGVATLLDKIDNYSKEEVLPNVLIYNANIYYLLDYFTENTFDNLYILFPDPWHKNKHHKRRLINEDNLTLFSKILKKDGVLRFVSDHADYVNWAIEHFEKSNNFKILNPDDFKITPADHFQTKYERKAIKEGREIAYLNIQNIK
ncbi:MAG: tRNA (guanosine(46)-N7)-methyltransferase TrmB [Alphaproteobacteria bacterium]|jgi:tRNA (guanine-N(7)-)-methyltransferase|nr:tRNA (guanosine(46)-N7)-methyltransferase TrmB [Alphaproteobacteria bacterium]